LLQHDIHVFNDRLEDVGGNTRTVQSERSDIVELSMGFKPNELGNVLILDFGEANLQAFIW
jgi:hypothetical protein